jgi:hypothetical protein
MRRPPDADRGPGDAQQADGIFRALMSSQITALGASGLPRDWRYECAIETRGPRLAGIDSIRWDTRDTASSRAPAFGNVTRVVALLWASSRRYSRHRAMVTRRVAESR